MPELRRAPLGQRLLLPLLLVWLAGMQLVAAGNQTAPGSARGAGQLAALMQLRSVLDPDGTLRGWTWERGANGGGYCNFSFVTCDAAKDVVSVQIMPFSHVGISLRGRLPPASLLARLPALRNFTLASHSLSGPLPADWARLAVHAPRLESLMLSDLGGAGGGMPLPADWARLQALTSLTLGRIPFTAGPLPPGWARLQRLRELRLDGVGAAGALPPEWGGLTGLRTLSLSNNDLSGQLPERWAPLVNMRSFTIWFNSRLSGTVPASWAAWRQLTDVGLSSTGITGCLPASWQLSLEPAAVVNLGAKITGFCR